MTTPPPTGPSSPPVAPCPIRSRPVRPAAPSVALVPDLADLRAALDGELFTPDSPGYDAIRRPANAAYREVRPRLVVRCRSLADVVRALAHAAATGDRLVPR